MVLESYWGRSVAKGSLMCWRCLEAWGVAKQGVWAEGLGTFCRLSGWSLEPRVSGVRGYVIQGLNVPPSECRTPTFFWIWDHGIQNIWGVLSTGLWVLDCVLPESTYSSSRVQILWGLLFMESWVPKSVFSEPKYSIHRVWSLSDQRFQDRGSRLLKCRWSKSPITYGLWGLLAMGSWLPGSFSIIRLQLLEPLRPPVYQTLGSRLLGVSTSRLQNLSAQGLPERGF